MFNFLQFEHQNKYIPSQLLWQTETPEINMFQCVKNYDTNKHNEHANVTACGARRISDE